MAVNGGTILAAGGVVIRPGSGDATEVLLVHRPRYKDWTFPKGKLRNGEAFEDGSLREVEEETGFHCAQIEELSGTSYIDHKGRPKMVRYWLMVPLRGDFLANEEVDQIRWVPLDQAQDALSYQHDRDLLGEVPDALGAGFVLLLRHASAGERRSWDGDDRLRPLDKKGSKQASAILESLGSAPLAGIASSPYLRCVQTVEPLGRERGIEVQVHRALAEGAPVDETLALLERVPAGTVACTHGDVIENLVGRELESKKGSIWVLRRHDGGRPEPVAHLAAPSVACE